MPRPRPVLVAGLEGPGPPGPSAFERWWSAYPKKRNKLDTEKAWRQTSKARPPIETLLRSLAEQQRSDDWRREGGRFIPYPATYLRAGGWQYDEATQEDPAERTVEQRVDDAWWVIEPELQRYPSPGPERDQVFLAIGIPQELVEEINRRDAASRRTAGGGA